LEIKSTKNIAENTTIRSISIGDSGKGKTRFSGSISKYGKPFVIDVEKGLTTCADLDIDYVEVDNWNQLTEAYSWFLKNYQEKGYTHLVIDSLTRLQEYWIRDNAPNGKMTQPQWGECLAWMKKFVDKVTKECPVHVHMTAMAMESKDELTGGIKVYPNIQGQFKHNLPGYFDVVLYHDCGVKDGNTIYWVQTEGDQRIIARNRLNAVAPMAKKEVSDYGIIARIYNGGNEQ